ncbi:MAG: ankyrin repeat domain-containing protein, partial [Waddliaceae bacterium]
ALIKAKADVNVQCLSEETALHMAVQKGNEEIVKALINANADLNRQAIDGKTPLDISLLLIDQSKQSTIRIVNTLTRAGAKESTDIKS